MEVPDRSQYQIAFVAPLRQNYEAATHLLEDARLEYSLATSGALCTLGKIGPHHFILAGSSRDNVDTALFVHNTVNDILTDFPSIRVGFLIGVDAVAPADGIAKTGDIVVGTPQGLEPGVVQFDSHQTTHLNRLSVTHQMSRPPYAVQSVVDSLRSGPGRLECQKSLLNSATAICDPATEQDNLNWSMSVKILHGKIASSPTDLPKDEVLNKIGRDSKVLCFERAAAKLKPHLPFITICGVTQTSNDFENNVRKQRAGTAAVIYAILIASKISPSQLEKQHAFIDLFSYKPFALERTGFRLIQLERGTGSPLRCSLFQAYLDEEDSIVPYEALSYVWGVQSIPCEIVVDGKIMSITASLYDALSHLRQTDEDRILWVDALCIDQSNIKERSHQVNHMGEIYRKADSVTIWLGYISGDASILKTLVDQFSKQLPPEAFRKWPREDERWRDQWWEAEKTLGISDDIKLLDGLNTFMDNPWFTRVWVLQEVANARRATIECNLGKISVKVLAMLPYIMGSPVNEQCQAVLDIMPGPLKNTSWWSQDRNLCTLLCKFKGSEASDPRDKVYALLGMASDMGVGAIEADYTKEENTIVQDLCLYLYGEKQPMEISSTTSIQTFQSRLSSMSTQLFVNRLMVNRLLHNTGTEGLLAFLNKQGTMRDISHDMIHTLLDHGGIPATIYLNKCEEPISINIDIAERALSKLPDIFDLFTQKRCVTPSLMGDLVWRVAKTNYRRLETFLESIAMTIDPDPEFVMNLMTNDPNYATKLLKLVFGAFRAPMVPDETVIINAISKSKTMLDILLRHCPRPVRITNKVLAEAIRAGIEILRAILETPRNNISTYYDCFKLSFAQGPTTLQTLLDHCDGSVRISSQLLEKEVQAGLDTVKRVLKMSSENWASDIDTTERITIRASLTGTWKLTHLINNSASKIQITDVVLERSKAFHPSYDMLLELRKSERDVTEMEAIGAIESGPETFLELLNRPGTNFRLTGWICLVAWKYHYVFDVLEKKRPSELFKYVSPSLRSEFRESDSVQGQKGSVGWDNTSVLSDAQRSILSGIFLGLQ